MLTPRTRAVFVVIGAGICLLAGYRLVEAAREALATGTVLLRDPRVSLPGRRGLQFPARWQDAWSVFLGWAVCALGGVCVALAGMRRLSFLLVAAILFLAGFMLVAAAPMLGSIAAVATLVGVWVAVSLAVITLLLLRAAREQRRVEDEPRLRDGGAGENGA